MLIVLTTHSDLDEAVRLGELLVKDRIAACVQILPKMTSIYAWEGKIEKEAEHLMLIKTLPEHYTAVEKFILGHHSYQTPEIVAIEPKHLSAGYSAWLETTLSPADK